jgi:RecB family exonuclease
MYRRTAVVCNTVGWHERRFRAALDREHGLRIVTIQQLAELLAGGFLRILGRPDLQQLVTRALSELSFGAIEPIKALPGMVNAVCRSLRKVWNANVDLHWWGGKCGDSVADLAAIESFVRSNLPPASLLPSQLLREAERHVHQARHLTGDVDIHGIVGFDVSWRPLLVDLSRHVAVRWHACKDDQDDLRWAESSGIEIVWHAGNHGTAEGVVCANPKHEALEALRWARELISSKRARPHEVAIVAASVEDWDDHLRALVADSLLPVHFVHGIPAVSRFEGQQCAALAEVMLHGLSHDRVVRALRATHDCDALVELPKDWYRKLTAAAPLLEREHWNFELKRIADQDEMELRPILEPVLDLLAAGPKGAVRAGETLLTRWALTTWQQAMLDGPPEALATTLAAQRVPDNTDPAGSILWGSAAALLGTERKFVRLLGLNSSQWPRRSREDSLLPSHLLPASQLEPLSRPDFDRLCLRYLRNRASAVVYSRSLRGSDGRLLGRSPLLPDGLCMRRFVRARIPAHAMSESDRLLANPNEFRQTPLAISARSCLTDWCDPELTAHDGIVRANHPAILRCLRKPHSTTSLRTLLTDPLAFLWQYCLGWWEPQDLAGEQPVVVDGLSEGSLFHKMLEHAARRLEHEPGAMAKVLPHQLEMAIEDAVNEVGESWGRANPVPPPRIWRRLLERGRDVVLAAFRGMPPSLEMQRTYVEVPFGYSEQSRDGRPWDPAVVVTFNANGFALPLRGRIDRLDLSGDGKRARVLDYKTVGKAPAEDPGLKQGQELQRCIYTHVVRQLLVGTDVEAALMYPGQTNGYFILSNANQMLAQLTANIEAAVHNAQRGCLPFGSLTEEKANKNYVYAPAFAYPANAKGLYFPLKRDARDVAVGDLLSLWTEVKA